MAEIIGPFGEKSCVKEKAPQKAMSNNTKSDLHNEAGQKLEETGDTLDYVDGRITEKRIKMLQITIDLQEIIINILREKLKLLDMRNKQFNNALINAAEDVLKAVDDDLRSCLDISGGSKICELQQIMKIIEEMNTESVKDFTDTIEKKLEEIHLIFLKYGETYKKSTILLINFLKNLENTLKLCKFPGNCLVQQRVSFSIFENKLASYKLIFASSEKAFNEFDSLIKSDMKISRQDIKKRINLLSTIFEKAKLVYDESKSLATALLNFDCSKV